MIRRPAALPRVLALAIVLALSFRGLAAGQGTTLRLAAQDDARDEVQRLVDDGARLELDGRWGEALTHYEEALRQHPHVEELERGFQFSRIHYDLGRRYADGSFVDSLATLPERDALALYSEVLLMIQSHHVDEPNWKLLADRGATSLEVALSEPAFAERHLPGVDAERIEAFRDELRDRLTGMTVGSRHDAREATALAARLAQRQLGVPIGAAVMEYVCGATNALDEYTTFLTADQLDETYSQIEGNFVGLGVELRGDDGALLILRVIAGSPAERAGIRARDRIVAVDGRTTKELDVDRASDLLQGPEGSMVDVTLVAPGQAARVLRVKREQVEVPSVDDVKLIDDADGIGYMKLTCFQKTTSKDVDAALWKLHRLGMKGLIVDLRGNPGGLLNSSVEIADKFIDAGAIVSTRGRNHAEDFNYSAHRPGTWKVPLVVLIDGDSASASEIFAGAIRDHHRGTIVGARSYGKGSVQGIFSLSIARAGLRLTTAKFFSPDGHPFSRVGVDPDVIVQRVARPIDGEVAFQSPDAEEEDAFLSAALQAARQQLARR